MAPRSLLRHIFRHGPHSKARGTTPAPEVSIQVPEKAPTAFSESISHQQLAITNDAPESPLAYKARSESRQSSVLEDIEEEREELAGGSEYSAEESGYSAGESHSDIDRASIADTLAALDLDIGTFTTRALVTATLTEAKIATYAHLDTIDTTLALLEVLDGFSQTITVLKEEMIVKKQVYEDKLTILEDFERAVGQMQFGEEDLGEEAQ